MKTASERKMVAIVVAVFVAFTTITHGVVMRSPERVLNAGTAVKTELKVPGAATEEPGIVTLALYGGFFLFIGTYYAYNGIDGGGAYTEEGPAYVYTGGCPCPNNAPSGPSTLDLVQELP